MVDFQSILNTKVDEAEAPKPLPEGTYLGRVSGHEFGESSQKKTPYCRIHCQPTEAMDDVDEEALNAVLAQVENDLSRRTLREDFYLTENALFRLREFLENHLKLETGGRPFAEVIPEMDGQFVKFRVYHELPQNADPATATPRARIAGFTAAE
jgi:hypothetical protein